MQENLLVFVLSGLAVVLGVLSAIAGLCYVLGFIIQRLESPRRSSAITTVPTENAQDDSLDDELIAAISAAVATSLEAPHRIVRINSKNAGAAWSYAGRSRHHSSHKTR